MQKRSGCDAEVVEDPPVRRLVLLHDDVDVAEVVGEAGLLELAPLVDEVALGDQHEAVVAAEVGEHVGTPASRRTGSVSIAMPRATISPITVAGTAPCVTVTAHSTIDSVNALTP